MANTENEALAQGPEQPEAPKKERLTRRERRKRWKAAKKAKRDELREFYRYAPWTKRVWNLYLKKPAGALLVIAVLLMLAATGVQTLIEAIQVPVYELLQKVGTSGELTEAQLARLYEESPLDEEGAAKINAFAPVGRDETWTICVYLVGSNLEDMDENDLSYLVSFQTREAAARIQAENRASRSEQLERFTGELKENGLELPAFFYQPDYPTASSTVVTDDVIVAPLKGAASADIDEMTSGVWSDNISIVIQTGGATRWSNNRVNPNRTQRFAYQGGQLREVSDMALVPSSVPETLADFIRFCEEEYPADHRMLVLWNHGGGPFGYGNDSIYGNKLTLKDIRSALESVCTPSHEQPPFDIIGFDACLMSTLEATHALDGYAAFFCLSEEVEPGEGWDYGPWLQAMTDDPTMSPARVAQAIADSFTDYYIAKGIRMPLLENDVTFSVLDGSRTEALYDAYCALAEKQLVDAAEDIGVLAEIGRCANKSTRFAQNYHNVYNMIDLGNYMDYLVDTYPYECSRVKDLMNEAVLYHRENGAVSDATGIAVYFPAEVSELNGLLYYLDYVYNISENDSVTALYYYKQAGCLTDELKEYVATLTDQEPKTLDVAPFRAFSRASADFDSEGFLLPVSAELQSMLVDYELELTRVDEKEGKLVCYGREQALRLDGEGHLVSEFDGEWIHLNNIPLYVDVVSSTPSATEYQAHVRHGSDEAYLMISRDRDTDELNITGLRKVSETDDVMSATRSVVELMPGDTLAPIYMITDLTSGSIYAEDGKKTTFNDRSDLELRPLPEGDYLSTAVISDQRGDSYYSEVVGSTLERGSMKNWRAEPAYFGRDY